MLDTLKRVCDDGGQLVNVIGSQFISDEKLLWITAVALQFEKLTAVFRIDPADDALTESIGIPKAEPDERFIALSHLPPWESCIGKGVRSGWQLTNQQGYADGVRLEFGNPDEPSSRVVELIGIASRIQLFAAAELK